MRQATHPLGSFLTNKQEGTDVTFVACT